MHRLARVIVGLIIMGVGLALMAYAPQITKAFDQSPEYVSYFRVGGMVTVVLGVLFVFGVLGGTTSVSELSLTETS